jgi:MFS family permease
MVSHAIVHTYELTIPILMVIWLVEFPVTEASLGLVAAVGYGLFGLGALPSGIVSDKFGSQRLIALCLAGMGVSFVMLSFASGILVIGIAIALWGAAASIYHPAGLSLISTGVEDSGSGFAFHGMAGNVGIAFGPLVSVLMLWVLDWQTLALVLSVPAFVAVGFILKADIDEVAASELASDDSGRTESPTSAAEIFSASKSLFLGGFAFVFLIIIFNGLYYRGILTFLPELLSDFVAIDPLGAQGDASGGQLKGSDFIYVGLLMVGIAGQYVGGRAIDRIPVERGLLIGYAILVGIALLFVPAAEAGLVALVAVSLLLGFFLFSLQPIYQATVAEYSPAEARGLSYGFTYLGQFGVGAMGAAVVGYILTFSTVATMFLVLGLFATIAAGVSGVLLAWSDPA